MKTQAKHVVMIDNFDSFTFNLVDYLKQTGARVTVYRNTVAIAVVDKLQPDAIMYSPGPGAPAQAGNMIALIQAFQEKVPQFGVCLGLQAMIEAFGGTLRVLPNPKHGKASLIQHDGQTIFQGLPNPLEVGRYHSLAADTMPEELLVSATTLEPEDGHKVVMAIRHKILPLEGVQFHPESILTFKDKAGLQMIHNFMQKI